MLLYNVTTKIDKDVEQDWLEWMLKKHIPDVMNTGQFIESRISRLLDQPEEDDATYAVQYLCESRERYDHYVKTFAPALRDEFNKKYKDKFVSFRTLMEMVE